MAGLLSEKINKNFIVFEGIDGSGKSTQIQLLKDYFQSKNHSDVVFTFEHTKDGQWSSKIEEVLSGKISDITPDKLQLLYILDRQDHIQNVIAPALKKNKIIFCDRYFLSTLAYGSISGIHWKTLWNNHKEVIGDQMIMPAKTFFFDVPSDIAINRIKNRGNPLTIFETIQKQEAVRNAYLSIGPHFEGFKVIDSSNSPQETFDLLKLELSEYL